VDGALADYPRISNAREVRTSELINDMLNTNVYDVWEAWNPVINRIKINPTLIQ